MDCTDILTRIETALAAGTEALKAFTPGKIQSTLKDGGDPVTEADKVLDDVLKNALLCDDEGWLSEETVDDPSRLQKDRIWIVDPIDGTREFIEGVPQWCMSIAYVVNGRPEAAGICNPAAGQTFLGTRNHVTLNGKPVTVSSQTELAGAMVLASRSEIKRGEWQPFENSGMSIVPMGSVAYKMACVAAGQYDMTFTLVPKNEWDVAAGWLLVEAAGGTVLDKNQQIRQFNQPDPLLPGLYAMNSTLLEAVLRITG